jgi:hypothetical protein
MTPHSIKKNLLIALICIRLEEKTSGDDEDYMANENGVKLNSGGHATAQNPATHPFS